MKLLSLDDVIAIAQETGMTKFNMLDGKEYHVIDATNKIFALKGFDGVITYGNLVSWYHKEKIFFE